LKIDSGYTVVVLAGGIGSRLKEIVSDVPKPMAPVRGRPFLEYLLSYWVKNNAQHIVLSVGYKYQKIMDYFGSSFNEVPITYVIEHEPLGTGGALLKVLNEIRPKDEFILVNGDTLFLIDPLRIFDLHIKNNADLSMSLRQVDDAGRYHRICPDKAGKIIAIEQPNKKVASGQINGGVYIVNPGLFSGYDYDENQNISFENEMLPALINKHNIYGFSDGGDFIDIGIPEDFHKAQDYLSDEILINKGAG
jgi:D-glycero-alpha-D-manno-heptose 1-phosphate guanylyltransferase